MVFLFWEQFEAGEGDMFYGQHRVGVRHHLLMLHFGDLEGADEGYEIGRGALTTGIADLFLDPLFEAQLHFHGLGLVHITAIGDIGIRVEAPDPNQVERAFQIMLAINYEALVTPRWGSGICRLTDGRGDRTGGGGGGGGGSGACGSSVLTWQTEGEKEEYGDHYRMIHSDFPRMTLVSVGGSGGREDERSIKVVDGSSCVKCWYCHGDDEECKTSKKMKEFHEQLKAEGLGSARGTMRSIKWAAELETAPEHLPPSEEEKIVLKVPIVSLEGRKEERQKAYTERVKMDGKKVVKKEEGKKVVKKEGKKFVQEAIKSMAEPITGTVGAIALLQEMTGLTHHAAVEALNQHKRAAERKVAK